MRFGGMVTRQVISPYPSGLAPRTTGSEERLKLIDLGGILVESLRMCSINWLNSGLSEWSNDQQMPNKSCKGESCQLEMAWSPCYFLTNCVTCPPVVQQSSDCLSSHTQLPCFHLSTLQIKNSSGCSNLIFIFCMANYIEWMINKILKSYCE